MYCTAHYAREGFLLLKGVHFNIQECIDQKHICYSVSTCTPIQIAMWKLSKCANIFWNVLKLYEALYWAVIVSNLLCAYRILTHTDKTPIAPISMKGSGFFQQQSYQPIPGESEAVGQKQKRVKTGSPNRVKIERQKQKGVKNRLSKYEANPKPIVKVRKQVKNRKNIRKIHCKYSPNAQKHQPHKSPKLPTENSNKECSYTCTPHVIIALYWSWTIFLIL